MAPATTGDRRLRCAARVSCDADADGPCEECLHAAGEGPGSTTPPAGPAYRGSKARERFSIIPKLRQPKPASTPNKSLHVFRRRLGIVAGMLKLEANALHLAGKPITEEALYPGMIRRGADLGFNNADVLSLSGILQIEGTLAAYRRRGDRRADRRRE